MRFRRGNPTRRDSKSAEIVAQPPKTKRAPTCARWFIHVSLTAQLVQHLPLLTESPAQLAKKPAVPQARPAIHNAIYVSLTENQPFCENDL
jgi:hypothetical protein